MLVVVPGEFAFELGEFDMLAVEFTDDSGAPVFGELLEFVDEVHLVGGGVGHGRPFDDEAHRRWHKPVTGCTVEISTRPRKR